MIVLKQASGPASSEHEELVPLLRADPHQWGSGRVHEIDEDIDKTLCGQTPAKCPGRKFYGRRDEITCKGCVRSREARLRAEESRRQWEIEKAEREELQRQWWAAYDEYLYSPTWQQKRALVLRRANGLCEGCGERRAVQAHHLQYPRECWPGSPQWIALEKLFDLRAVCEICHDDVHASRRFP